MGLFRNRLHDRIRPPPGPPPDLPPHAMPQPPDATNVSGAAPPGGLLEAVHAKSRVSLGSGGSSTRRRHHKQPQAHPQPRPPRSPSASSAASPRPTLTERVAGSFSRMHHGSVAGRSAGRAPSTDTSARSTVRDHASKFRRLLRERVALGSRDSDASMQLDDVPDTADPFPDPLSDAAFSIAAAAAATSPTGRGPLRGAGVASPPVGASSGALGASAQQYEQYRGGSSGGGGGGRGGSPPHLALPLSVVQRGMPTDVAGGETCSDGVISFVVPAGWVATRTMDDSFCVVNGLSLGYVRAVKANCAAEALLETDRLQVMSHVTALSSPVFVEDELGRMAVVNYLSTMGRGKGVAVFPENGSGCAVVFALCGPSEEQEMIQRSIHDLRRTAKPPSADVCTAAVERGKGAGAAEREAVAVRKDSEERKSVISDMPGLSESLARLEHDLKPKAEVAAAATCVLQ